jgi:thiamine biosynthesis lipoprotein
MLSPAMNRLVQILVVTHICLYLGACIEQSSERKREYLVFGTLLEVSTWGAGEEQSSRAFGRLEAEFQSMHRDWHAWEPGLLTSVNDAFAAGRPARASPALVELTRHSQFMEERTEGRFNASIGALVRLWGFHTSVYPIEGPPPAREQIEQLVLQNPSSLDIRVDGLEMSTRNHTVQLDFGGIAKGYAIDLAIETLRQMGIDNAIVNAGGDLRAVGKHGDRPWRIAVRDPSGGIIGIVEAGEDEAIFTSGNYERFRQENNRRFPHILDPRTGWPVKELSSATVISGEGWFADAAATALIVAGKDGWREVALALGLDKVLIVDETGAIHLTPEMKSRIEFTGSGEKVIAPL